MTRSPVTVTRDTLAAEALHILEQRKITPSWSSTSTARARRGAPARPLATEMI
jgi:hypothetical protein